MVSEVLGCAFRLVRFVAHTSSCISPWPGGIQATCIWYPARHRQTVHFVEQEEE